MNFGQKLGFADSCYFGCPSTDVQTLERLVTHLESESEDIGNACLRVGGFGIFTKAVDQVTKNALRTVEAAPDLFTYKGAWRPDTSLHSAVSLLVCGQMASVVVFAEYGKTLQGVRH